MSTHTRPGTIVGSSDNVIIGSLVVSVLLLLTGPGVFAGFVLAVLTTSAIFLNPRLRSRIQFPVTGIITTLATGSFVFIWIASG